MPEPSVTDPTIASGLKESLLYVGGLLLALLGYNARTVIKRVDAHDDDLNEKIDKEEYNKTIGSIRSEIQRGNDEMKAAHKEQVAETRRVHEDQNTRFETHMTRMHDRVDRILETKKHDKT